ncbi:MAG: FAD-dependent oxidoreductase [Ruminococcaceae bacterium]|nr:FAD-dependent oxidoreductase [Oscillospiraceae bacterium]
MLYQAHKGVSTEFPENTMPAFRAAVQQGYNIIELDVSVTADGQFVLLHDSKLNRTGRNADGSELPAPVAIGEITYAETQAYDFGIWRGEKFRGTKMPLFTEVLAFARRSGVRLKIDNKYQHFTETQKTAFYDLLRSWEDTACLTCKDMQALAEAAAVFQQMHFHYDGPVTPEILEELASLLPKDRLTVWMPVRNKNTTWVKVAFLNKETAAQIKKCASLGVWILSEESELAEAERLGADIIETNGQLKPTLPFQTKLRSLGNYDVVVLGGGPAGVCAAIEAARSGARVLLAEDSGMLGGMATSGLVGPLMTSYDKEGNRPLVGGLYREIAEKLALNGDAILPENADAPSVYTSFIRRYHKHVTPFDSFAMQLLLDRMTKEAGVDVLLYTRFADCICENGRIRAVVLAALEGLRYVCADVFIDCTGTASVADACGVPTYKGEETTHIPQPGTLMFEVNHVRDEAYKLRPRYPVKAYRTSKAGTYKVNHHHVYDVDAADSRSMSEAHAEARRQVWDAFHQLREEAEGFENAELTQVAPVLGVRESRHIEGRYKITVADVSAGVCFPDRIAAYGFGMDVHPRDAQTSGNFKIEIADAYYIPYRSLLPLGCDNLLVAGKTVSCESQAAGGLRCMPCAMAMGQAAGAAAAMAAAQKIDAADVDIHALQAHLRARGAIID